MALLLVSGLVLCLAHAETGDAEDMCAGFGPTIGPVTLLPLAMLGPADLPPVTLYQVVSEVVSRVAGGAGPSGRSGRAGPGP